MHSRKYTDTKVILDLLSEHHGLLSAVYRPARKSGSGIQGFCEYVVAWKGQSELKTLVQLDPVAGACELQGVALYCGLYINELLVRLLHKHDPLNGLFEAYCHCLQYLSSEASREIALRQFEIYLLGAIGYGVNFVEDCEGQEITADKLSIYCYIPAQGFRRVLNSKNEDRPGDTFSGVTENKKLASIPLDRRTNSDGRGEAYFSGYELSRIGQFRLEEAQIRKQAKLLCRLILNSLLGDKPLKSRELFL